MIKNIINILNNKTSINGWLLNEVKTESRELFFVKKELNMNRKKKVHHFELTVYKDFEEEGIKYKGSASVKLSPSMNSDEIDKKINQASYSASFVKNPYYNLVAPTENKLKELKSKFDSKEIFDTLPKIVDALYINDNHEKGNVNSCEIFVETTDKRIINSLGVDESYISNSGQIELVIDWKEKGEEVEVIENLSFSNFNFEDIKKRVEEAFDNAKNRAVAKPTYSLEEVPTVLTGESIKEFFSYYVVKANAEMIYKKYSQLKIGENIQGEDIVGDKVSINLLPEISNSISSSYIDTDGVKLEELSLYEEGILKNYHGDARHSQYLEIPITGKIPNVKVCGGSKTKIELLEDKCLELISFSDFQMDPITGHFGGEIRLAKFHDGKNIIPLTGGAITGYIDKTQKNMLLSKETQDIRDYIIPTAIKIFDFNLTI